MTSSIREARVARNRQIKISVTRSEAVHSVPISELGVKTFSMSSQRDLPALGEVVTAWLRAHPQYQPVDRQVTQSSHDTHHCLTITITYRLLR